MANTSSAKGNPAWKRMLNPNNKAKRARNKAKNEQLKAKGLHPKQLRAKAQEDRHQANKSEMEALGLKNRKQVHKHRQVQKRAGVDPAPASLLP